MKRFILALVFVSVGFVVSASRPLVGFIAAGDEIDFQKIDQYITTQKSSARIPGLAVGIVRGDRILYLKGYGQADSSGRLITPQTPFIIGSVTKAFTALATMQLVEAGKLDLDTPVITYIPWFRVGDTDASTQITVRELLNQTSGIPQPQADQVVTVSDASALERNVRALADLQLLGPPGKSFAYSNGNYQTLGLLVQTVSDQSFENYVKEHVFAPLDMHNSFVSQDQAIQHGMAEGHTWWFGVPVAVTLPFNRGDLPAGFIFSSAEDMSHFVIAEMNGGQFRGSSVLSPKGIKLTQTEPVANTYGMGWETVSLNGRTLINHDGGVPNFQASVFFDPETHVGVFIAANIESMVDAFSSPHGADPSDGNTARAMAASILSIATNQPLPEQGPGNARLYLVLDLIVVLLTGLLVLWFARIPKRYRTWKARRIGSGSEWVLRSVWVAAAHFVFPVLVLYAILRVPLWNTVMLYEPGLAYWLTAVAILLVLAGFLELGLLAKAVLETRQPTVMQSG